MLGREPSRLLPVPPRFCGIAGLVDYVSEAEADGWLLLLQRSHRLHRVGRGAVFVALHRAIRLECVAAHVGWIESRLLVCKIHSRTPLTFCRQLLAGLKIRLRQQRTELLL